MTTTNTRPLILYHDHCTDGYGAAFAAWCKFGDAADYVPVKYGDPAPDVTGREVYVLDFSYPKDVTQQMIDTAKRFVWLDHHASVLAEWGEGTWPAGVEVELSNGAVAFVDAADVPTVAQYSWSAHVRGGAVAYMGGDRAASKNEYMHHLLLPQKEGFVVDHANRNTLDNRRCNLRYATRSENGANMDRGSRYKGVTPHGSGFKAQIMADGLNRVLGTFASGEDAAVAYDEAARLQWGVFARVNFGQREPFPPTAHVVLDNSKSGALLAWEYFMPTIAVPRIIQRIDDRDRWVFQYPDSKAMHAGLQTMKPWSFAQWKALTPMGTTDWHRNLNDVTSAGAATLQVHKGLIDGAAKRATKCTIPAGEPTTELMHNPWEYLYTENSGKHHWAVPGLSVNSPVLQSEIGHELANTSSTYGLVWYYDGTTGRANCSLRSNGDYDVSAIAKRFGGGGHKNAAGFNIDMPTLLGWLK